MAEAGDKRVKLEKLAEEVRQLSESPLYAYRQQNGYQPVIGEGDTDAAIMLIGEAPGEWEAKSGRPFVGASGRFLDELLSSIGLARKEVYITNVVKDRPPENRDPTAKEIQLYAPYLARQIEIIRPKVLATLGRFAMEYILKTFSAFDEQPKISVWHGKAIAGQASYGPVSIVPLYHPAAALYTAALRNTLMQDFQILKPFGANAG